MHNCVRLTITMKPLTALKSMTIDENNLNLLRWQLTPQDGQTWHHCSQICAKLLLYSQVLVNAQRLSHYFMKQQTLSHFKSFTGIYCTTFPSTWVRFCLFFIFRWCGFMKCMLLQTKEMFEMLFLSISMDNQTCKAKTVWRIWKLPNKLLLQNWESLDHWLWHGQKVQDSGEHGAIADS